MNKKNHLKNLWVSVVYLAGMLLLVLTLDACDAKPMGVVPTQQPAAEIEATLQPSPTPTPSISSDAYSRVFLPLVTKPDVPPQTINGVTVAIDWAYADESRVTFTYVISGLDWPDGAFIEPHR